MKIAHALLIHGERLRDGMSQEEFWRLVPGREGKAIAKNTGSRTVDDRARLGGYLAKGPLRLGPGLGLLIAVSVGSESLRAVVVDANGRLCAGDDGALLAVEAPPLPGQSDLGPTALIDRIAAVVRDLMRRALDAESLLVRGTLPVLGVAVAWPAPLSRSEKRPTGHALGDPGWTEDGAPGVHELLARRLGLPVDRSHALNKANAVAVAEAFDQSRRPPAPSRTRLAGTVLAIHAGGGVGAGTVVMGALDEQSSRSAFLGARLLEGTQGYAGELGHWQVPAADVREITEERRDPELAKPPTLRCTCGSTACLSTLASAPAFLARMEASGVRIPGLAPGGDRAAASAMRDALRDLPDARQRRALEDIGRLIGRSLAAPVLMLNPKSITVAGSLAVPEVLHGIETEKGRWRHVLDSGIRVRLLEGADNRFSSARGAALIAFRGRLYRRLEELGRSEELLRELTLPVDRGFLERMPA